MRQMANARSSLHNRRFDAPADIRIRNNILSALLSTQYRDVPPKLKHVELKRGEIVYRADQKIEYVYFPEEAVIAMVDTAADRRTVEVGTVGAEGLVGINVFLGGITTPDKAIVQLPGGAMRMKAKDLRKALRIGSPLQRLLLEYTRSFLAVISQSVACSQHHDIAQRLARWILTMNDYAGPGEFQMVQRSIAAMLGTRRESISEAAANLQSASLINYRRGRIVVLDKRGLAKQSFECYRFIKNQYKNLHREVPRLLSDA